jgi:hypothetical protein
MICRDVDGACSSGNTERNLFGGTSTIYIAGR